MREQACLLNGTVSRSFDASSKARDGDSVASAILSVNAIEKRSFMFFVLFFFSIQIKLA